MDHVDARGSQQDHRDRDAAGTQSHIPDQGIALFQLAVEEGDDRFLGYQLRGPVEPELKHALHPLRDAELTIFIDKRSLIDDLHVD